MNWGLFIINSVLLGVGLAMDAFSVSLANGLNEPDMKKPRVILIAGTYAVFQFLMPIIGWFCVHTLVEKFTRFDRFVPWIAFILLLYIGIKMIAEALRKKDDPEGKGKPLSHLMLLLQGIATSIDALSVGFTIADYELLTALCASAIIAVITFALCTFALLIGKKAGSYLNRRASLLGGIILIGIGIEIFVKGLFF